MPVLTMPTGPVSVDTVLALQAAIGVGPANELIAMINSLLRLNQNPVVFSHAIEFQSDVKIDGTLQVIGDVQANDGDCLFAAVTLGDLHADTVSVTRFVNADSAAFASTVTTGDTLTITNGGLNVALGGITLPTGGIDITDGSITVDRGSLNLTFGQIVCTNGDIAVAAGLVKAIGFSKAPDTATPTITISAEWGEARVCSVTGNGSRGTISVGSGAVPAAVAVVTITYAVDGMYGANPKVIIESEKPVEVNIVEEASDHFMFYLPNAPAANTTYLFRYRVEG